MNQHNFTRRGLLLASLVLCLGAAIRLSGLDNHSIWFDELVTWRMGLRPLWGSDPGRSILGTAMRDTGMGPLGYLLDGMLARMVFVPGGENWLRVPGVTASVVTMAVVLLMRKRWFGGNAGGTAALLVIALHPTWIALSLSSRGYSWTLLTGVLQWGLLLELGRRAVGVAGEPSLRLSTGAPRTVINQYASFALLSLAGILIHPLYSPVSGALWLILIWRRRSAARSRIGQIRYARFAGVAWATWLLILAFLTTWMLMVTGQSSALLSGRPQVPLGSTLPKLFDALRQQPELALTFALLAVLLGAGTLSNTMRRLRPVIRISALVIVLEAFAAFLLIHRFFLDQRHLFPLLLPLVWLSALLAENLHRKWVRSSFATLSIRRTLALLLVLALCLRLTPYGMARARQPVQDWKAVAHWIQRHPEIGGIICFRNTERETLAAYIGGSADYETTRPIRLVGNRIFQRICREPGFESWIVATAWWGDPIPSSSRSCLARRFRPHLTRPGLKPLQVFVQETTPR